MGGAHKAVILLQRHQQNNKQLWARRKGKGTATGRQKIRVLRTEGRFTLQLLQKKLG